MTLSRPRDFSGGEEFGKIVPEFSMQPDFDIGFTSNEFLGAFNEDVMDFDWVRSLMNTCKLYKLIFSRHSSTTTFDKRNLKKLG